MLTPLFTNLSVMLQALPKTRQWQLAFLVFLQILSGFSEVISLGAIIPFLNALVDIDSFLAHPYVASVLEVIGIQEKTHVIALTAATFAIAIVCANLLRFFTQWFQLKLSAKIGTDIGTLLFTKTLHNKYSFFLQNNSNELIGNLTHDLGGALGILYGILTLMTQGFIVISVAIGLVIYDPVIALILFLIGGISYLLIILLVQERLRHNSLILSDSYRNILKSLQEGFGSIRYIILDQTYNTFTEHYKKTDHRHRSTAAENSIIKVAPRFLIESVGVITICLLTIWLAFVETDIKDFVPFLGFIALASHRLLPAMQQMYNALSSMMGLLVSLDRVTEVLSNKKLDNQKHDYPPLLLCNDLALEDVFFSYEENQDKGWVLNNINLNLPAKCTVAIVGQTGSGKSTLMDLILGLIEPQKGTISVDGTPLDKDTIPEWQAGISHVPQDVFIIDNSLAENIAFGVPKDEINLEKVKNAAKEAKIHDFIESLPHQYHTVAGERGVKLSGGQKQRIGIARALYSNPSLIVFDEATSALDSDTEAKVMEAIHNLGEHLTVILIAHRISTIKNADKIIVLTEGKVAAEGTYAELLETSEDFKILCAEMN